ncbi:MAG TPA: LysR family transcriptional regulator [Bryobacteraceae bacterium]|nr:LysR family transcriptional regulator [Bryobacteraceae bacterium]
MRVTQLRQADLNLLVVFTVLAEERNVSRAADRLLLSQPAVSRALQRLRETFHDDLLVRTPAGYEVTPLGQRLLQELEGMLPRLDRLLSGSHFDPETEEATFRVAATDYASHVLCPLLCHSFLPTQGKVSFEFMAWHDGTFEALERGRLDLLLNADDGEIPAHFLSEVIFAEEFVCVVSKAAPYARGLTLKQYLSASHIGVSVLGGRQTIPENRLAAIGEKRHCAIRMPYFAAAVRSVAGTNLVATVPRRLAEYEAGNPGIKMVEAPDVMGSFRYLMAWHPRMNTDAAHEWLRGTMREAGKRLT